MPVSSRAWWRPFRFISRYTKSDSAPAYSTAMQADSVAVNQPKILPPTMMNGVARAGIDTTAATSSSRQVERG